MIEWILETIELGGLFWGLWWLRGFSTETELRIRTAIGGRRKIRDRLDRLEEWQRDTMIAVALHTKSEDDGE